MKSQQTKVHKRASQHISHFKAGTANRLAQDAEIHIEWKELRQLLFSQTFGRLSRDAPAKLLLCDAERMQENSRKQRIRDFPLCAEKMMIQGKVATLVKKHYASKNYRLNVQLQVQ